jgi:hypothetical protein
MWGLREYYIGGDGQAPFCYVVNPVATTGGHGVNYVARNLVFIPPDSVSSPNTLRICAWFARYGEPGPEVLAWLRDGAFRMGTGVDRGRLPGGVGGLRGAFGRPVREYYVPDVSPRGLACLGDLPEACRAAFAAPGDGFPAWGYDRTELAAYVEGSPVDFLGLRWWGGADLGQHEQFLFQDLVEEFGPARFGAFWRSDADLEKAFESAFGVPVAQWMMTWARRHYGELQRGPGVPARASLFTFLTLGLLVGGAMYMGRR